jgi:hypothetical protein
MAGQKRVALDVPAIHVFIAAKFKTWMPGTSPGMTMFQGPRSVYEEADFKLVARMSEATSGNERDAGPGYRFAHPATALPLRLLQQRQISILALEFFQAAVPRFDAERPDRDDL